MRSGPTRRTYAETASTHPEETKGNTVTATTTPPARPTGAVKAEHMSRNYFDAEGRRHTAHIPVPIDENGEIAAKPFKCSRCVEAVWKPLGYKGTPACRVHNRKMEPYVLRRPPLLPWRALWDVCEKPLRPVWALPGMAAVGQMVDAGDVPTLAMVAAAPLAFEATRRIWRRRSLRMAAKAGRLVLHDPTQDRKLRFAIDAAARKAGYAAAGGTGWLAAVAALGMDPETLAGKIALTAAIIPWLPVAATYWHKLRQGRRAPEPVLVIDAEPAPEAPKMDPEERRVRHTWNTLLAVRSGDIIGKADDGTPVKATAPGKLPGTRLEDWHRVEGGWAATVIGPIGSYESEQFTASIGRIASAFSAKKSMVTVIPDGDDENRALVLLQKSSPLTESRRWEGPDSIDVKKGTAPVVTYADGTKGMYEIYRPGWGVPHVAAFGTTGSAKSEFLNLLFTIDRWAQYEGRGLVAGFLIDPQQGQSFPDFKDDLAAPPACSIEEAIMLARALEREGLRRNRYLSHEAKFWDERLKKWRTGRKWWNPLIDGPILSLTIDEAHDYLSNREFATIITKGGRMWRKCGIQLRIATHTPLLNDLGGQTALRDMLTGCFVWMGRTANSLSGPIAFNGRLAVDPRSIPAVPGMAYILSGATPKPMLGRSDWEGELRPNEDGEMELQSVWYDWVRDAGNNPIGYPGVLPLETLEAFGPEYAHWIRLANGEAGVEQLPAERPERHTAKPTDAVLAALWVFNPNPVDMNTLMGALDAADVDADVLAVREALAELRGDEMVENVDGLHRLTEQGQAVMEELIA